MKAGIHPTWYEDALVVCACGNSWHTGSTKKEIHTDVCSACHPFYTGEQRIVDTAGQVERFMKRVSAKEQLAPKPEVQEKPTKKERRARARGDMRSGMRGVQVSTEEPAAPTAEAPAPSAVSAEVPVPEAIMIEPTPEGRVWEPVSVEPVESTPAVQVAAPVPESMAGSEDAEPKAELMVDETVKTAQLANPEPEAGIPAESVSPQTAAGETAQSIAPTGERPARQRNRPPRKPRAEKPAEAPSEQTAEPPADSKPPSEASGGE